jgi:hypothetical protein
LVEHFEAKGTKIILISEYGINEVNQPIHINRFLRSKGHLAIREERGLELLDPGASHAFSCSDHQIAHIYVKDKKDIAFIKKQLSELDGIEKLLSGQELKEFHIHHERCGDIVAIAKSHAWFTYYYWLDDQKAPDFARLVDIHRKPGYDPAEMFMNPKNPFIKLRAAYKLARKLLGFRYLMDVIPLDASIVKGSHGSPFCEKKYYPLLIHSEDLGDEIPATQVYDVIWKSIFS